MRLIELMNKKWGILMGLVTKLFGIFLLFCSVQAVHAVPLLFWSANGSTIQRAQTDGSGLTDMVTGQFFAVGVAVDADAQKVYWNDQGNPGAIRRSNVDGTEIEDVTSSVTGARGMDAEGNGQGWPSADSETRRGGSSRG